MPIVTVSSLGKRTPYCVSAHPPLEGLSTHRRLRGILWWIMFERMPSSVCIIIVYVQTLILVLPYFLH